MGARTGAWWRPDLAPAAVCCKKACGSDDGILFCREEELVSLLRTILGQGTERLLQARHIMLELQSRAERTIHCLHKLRALVPSEVKWLSVFKKAKRQCVVASGVVHTAPQRVGPCVGAKKIPFLLWML